ncbi:MAG: response regulator transcription factor [Actinomycetota bacterium]|nr:response regulator transcription factor [Actinomycetota bacterium]MDI6822435.1 response regulator transcription factor [Actinomycetota bacterium]
MGRLKVLIAEDHELMRKGLRSVLQLEDAFDIVGEAKDGQEAIEKAKTHQPDVVLMDLRMPDVDGIRACREIHSRFPEIKILVLTAYETDEDIFTSLQAGISGYLLKDISPEELLKAIRTVSEGKSILHPSVARKVLDRLSSPLESQMSDCESSPLTAREKEVLNLMTRGLKNRDIAKTLFISEKTVKTHVSSILRKLKQSDRTQAVLHAIRQGLAK